MLSTIARHGISDDREPAPLFTNEGNDEVGVGLGGRDCEIKGPDLRGRAKDSFGGGTPLFEPERR